MNVHCIETRIEGRRIHCWQRTGLDNVDDQLCTTRRCTWCGQEQHKRYGAGGGRGWQVTE